MLKLQSWFLFAIFSLLWGTAAILGTLAFLFALSKWKASLVITMTALYPVVALILSFIVLHESITLKQSIWIFLSLIAIVLIYS